MTIRYRWEAFVALLLGGGVLLSEAVSYPASAQGGVLFALLLGIGVGSETMLLLRETTANTTESDGDA